MELNVSIEHNGARLSLSWQGAADVLQRQLEGCSTASSGDLFLSTSPKMASEMSQLLVQALQGFEKEFLVRSCEFLHEEANVMCTPNGVQSD